MTERKTLYLRVGTHKTGTTAIQAFVTTHSESFARTGLFVPRTGRIDEASGHHRRAGTTILPGSSMPMPVIAPDSGPWRDCVRNSRQARRRRRS